MMQILRFRTFLLPVLGLFLGAMPSLCLAAAVKGTLTLPTEARGQRRFPGYWRAEGKLPIVVPHSAGETVVFLTGIRAQTIPPKSTSIDINGLKANPSTVVVIEGSVVEFKNSDKVTHELMIPEQSQIMPPERLSPGSVRKVRFSKPGEYQVQCTEYPHLMMSILVTNTSLFAWVDEKGFFQFPVSPEGKGILKVWSRGRWIHEQPVEVTAQALNLNIKVATDSKKNSLE